MPQSRRPIKWRPPYLWCLFWDEHILVLRPSLLRKYSEHKKGAYALELQRVWSEGALAATQLGTAALNGDKTLGGEQAGAASYPRQRSSAQRPPWKHQTTQTLNVKVKKLALCMPESPMGSMELHFHVFLISWQDRGEMSASRPATEILIYDGASFVRVLTF